MEIEETKQTKCASDILVRPSHQLPDSLPLFVRPLLDRNICSRIGREKENGGKLKLSGAGQSAFQNSMEHASSFHSSFSSAVWLRRVYILIWKVSIFQTRKATLSSKIILSLEMSFGYFSGGGLQEAIVRNRMQKE